MKFTYEEEGVNREFVINGGQIRIGRDPEGEIVTKNRSVSRKHVTCSVENGQVVAHDEGSANGMFVNDVRVTEAVLKDGDVLRAGQFALTFSAGATAGGGFMVASPKQDLDGTMVDMAFGGAAEIPQAPPPPQPDMAAAFAQAAAPPAVMHAAPPMQAPMPAYAPPPPAAPAPAYPAPAPYAPTGYPPPPAYGTPPGPPGMGAPPAQGGFPPPPPPAAVAGGAGTALGTIKIIKGMDPKSFELRAGAKMTIGTKEDNPIVILGEGISRHHSEVFPRGKDWVVKDLGSKNGTYVNSQKVTERVLQNNDVIAIGSVQLKFNLAGAGGGKAGGGGGGDAAKKKKLILIAGGGVVLLCVLMIAMGGGGGDGGGGGQGPVTATNNDGGGGGSGGGIAPEKLSMMIQRALDTYNQALRARFLDPTQNGQTSALLAELNSPNVMPPAHQDKPAISRLASILTECQNRQPSYAEMNWKELEQRAIELRNYPTVGKLADKLIEWVRAENTAKGHMGDGKDYVRSNRHDEAFSAFKKIDQESVYYKEAANKMLELKGVITDQTVRLANQKVRSGDFQSSLDEINRVLNLFEARYPDVLVTLNPLKKECEKNLKYQNLVSEAEILIAQKRLDESEQKLASVDLGAPPSVLTKVEKLREEIGVQRAMSAANERYMNGDGKAAIQILMNETHPDLIKLRTKIQKVVDATTAAQNATAKNLFDEAKRHWGEVLGLEPDEKNRYNQEASKQVGGGPSFKDAADKEYQKGYEAQQADQLGEAREHYEKAMQLYPNHDESVAAIKTFVRDVQKTYNFDKMAFQRGQLTLDVIIPKWENILAFLRPQDGGVYTMFKEGVDKLRTTGKF